MEYILGISHFSIAVPDVDASVNFYCTGLGLSLKRRDSYNAIVETPDGIILEITPGGTSDGNQSGITHVCYDTYDVDKAFARALSFGAKPSRPADPGPYTYKNLRMAFVRAPSGEEIELWSVRRPDGAFGENAPAGKYVRRFVHVALTVPDMPACVRFYQKLGARLKEDWQWGCSMTLPDGRELELFSGAEKPQKEESYSHYCLITDSVENTLHAVTEAGGRILHEPYDWSNLRVAFASGIAGETIELFSYYGDGRQPDVFACAPKPLPDLFAKREGIE